MSGFIIITLVNINKWWRPFCLHSTKDDLFVSLLCVGDFGAPFQDNLAFVWLFCELITWKLM